MISDSHVHTYHSGDSKADINLVIQQAISKGMPYLAITDHHDFFIENGLFVLDFEAYVKEIKELQDKCNNSDFTLIFGLEQGLDPRFTDDINKITSTYDFDFIIGSSHIANGVDPYHKIYWENRSVHEGMVEYFESILNNLSIYDNFDVYGHIDYAIRYTPEGPGTYDYADYKDLLDEILKTIIHKGKGIEINTSNLRKGLNYTNPTAQVIKRYNELGGEIITVGSDSHQDDENGVGYGFDTARQILLNSGFKHYNVFKGRKPIYLDL